MAIDNCAIRDMEKDKFVESATRSGLPAVDVNIANPDDILAGSPVTPDIYNVSALIASTEYSQALKTGTKQFLIRVRDGANLQLAFTSNESSTIFITIPAGASYSETLNFSNVTLYFQTDKASQTVEILEWS